MGCFVICIGDSLILIYLSQCHIKGHCKNWWPQIEWYSFNLFIFYTIHLRILACCGNPASWRPTLYCELEICWWRNTFPLQSAFWCKIEWNFDWKFDFAFQQNCVIRNATVNHQYPPNGEEREGVGCPFQVDQNSSNFDIFLMTF